ncbi:MAG TPA: exodeoxyribonuclease VII large subunit, partial [Polyangiaceae bacterium]|nr:exodeoxyribonuclease VII large subunit [Polyangiaceae bacterium]
MATPPEIPSPSSEPTVWSVAELDRRLRFAAEKVSGGVWVQGEVQAVKTASSGHMYFTLKDEQQDAMIEAVAYRDDALRVRRVLVDGTRIMARGKATVWAPRGKLQFVVEAARPVGKGALLEALERLKEKLRAEGLFDPARKRPIPTDAHRIGVVTSASGAVIHDIIRVAFRRGSPNILLAPAQVQGEEAPRSLMAALGMLQRVQGLDVIIVGRGGGSLEDLMAFNDERLVRFVAACPIPTISAVGHELDVTLLDWVADARAATPSQAAEMVVADRQQSARSLTHLRTRMQRAMTTHLREDRIAFEKLQTRLGDPKRSLDERAQGLDDLIQRAQGALRAKQISSRSRLEQWEKRLIARHPSTVLAKTRGDLDSLRLRIASAMQAKMQSQQAALSKTSARLEALSPLAVLARGYAIVARPDGQTLMDASHVAVADMVTVRLSKGRLSAE